MATLTGNAINTSYQGLIKTDDNAAFGAAEKRVTDGLGNATNMTIGTGGTSFDSGTVNFTGATVTGLPSAGGNTVAAIRAQLPAVPMNNFGTTGNEDGNWRTHTWATGYALRNIANAADLGNIGFVIYPMSPGEKLNRLRFNVGLAGSAGSFINLAIYDLTYRNGGGVGEWSSGIVCNDLVKDLGQVATDTAGVKTIDITANPYVMPTDSTWGAIAIAWATGVANAGDTAALISGWDNEVWDGNGAYITGTTVYRAIGPFYDYGLTAPYTLPANLSDPTLKVSADTGDPFWSLIQTSFE